MTFVNVAALNGTNPTPVFVGSTYNANPDRVSVFGMFHSVMKTAGFVVAATGDAITAQLGDGFTNNLTNFPDTLNDNTIGNLYFVGSTCNLRVWAIYTTPAGSPFSGTFHVSIQQTAEGTWRVKVSCGGFNIAGVFDGGGTPGMLRGTPNQVPGPATLNDEKVIWGNGVSSDSAPVGLYVLVAAGLNKLNIAVEGGTTNPRFRFSTWVNNTNSGVAFGFLDFAQILSTGDTFPYVCGFNSEASMSYLASSMVSSEAIQYGAATRFGTGLTTKVGAGFYGAIAEPWVGLFGVNTVTLKEDPTPVGWGRAQTVASPNGFKGISTLLRWRGAAHNNADMVSTTGVNTYDWMAVNDVLVPWNLAPIVAVR